MRIVGALVLAIALGLAQENISSPSPVNVYSSGSAITNTSGALDINVKSSSISNQTTNTAQIGGASYALGSTTMSASAPTVQATNQGNPCFNPNSTPTTLTGATSGTSATQLIALTASQQIFLCSVVLTSLTGTSPTYKLEYGTGTNCGTLVGTLVGPSAASTLGNIFSYPNSFIVPASDELCYLVGGTSTPTYNYAIVYVKQ